MSDLATTSSVSATPPAPITLDATVSAVLAKANAAADATETVTPKPEAKTPSIDIDPSTLKQLTKLTREKRELEARVTKFETTSKDAELALEAMKLFKEGKKLEGIAKLTGADPTDEMTQLLEDYVKSPDEKAEKDLAAKVDELTKKIDADEKARNEATEKHKLAAAEVEKKQAVAFADRQLDTLKDKYELCGRADNRAEASHAALDAVIYLADKRKISLDGISETEAAKLFEEAYAGIEAQLEALGTRYTKAKSGDSYTDTSVSRSGMSTAVKPIPQNNLDKAIEAVLARAEAEATY